MAYVEKLTINMLTSKDTIYTVLTSEDTGHTMLDSEVQKLLLLKSGSRLSCPPPQLLFSVTLEVSENSLAGKGAHTARSSLLVGDRLLCLGKPQRFPPQIPGEVLRDSGR